MSDVPPLLSAQQLSRKFNHLEALQETTFSILPGRLVILRGPNGAGKSTLLHCLSGLLPPTTGRVYIAGHDLYAGEVDAKRAVAFVPDVPRFYPGLTGWEHLQFVAQAHHAGALFLARAEELLNDYGLMAVRDQYPHTYSRGMRLKLGLLTALVRPFRVLLLDEPASALDADSLDLLAETIQDLRREGRSILLSSHTTGLSERLPADHTWHMFNGRLIQG